MAIGGLGSLNGSRRGEAEESHLGSTGKFDHRVRLEVRLAGLRIEHVGRKHRELGKAFVCCQLILATVELMIPHRHGSVTACIHERDARLAI